MNHTRKRPQIAVLVVAASLLAAPMALADAVTDWNIKAGEIVVEAKLPTPPANRVLAIAQTAVYEAVNAITKVYPDSELQLEAASGASVEAAIAAANHATLAKLLPSQQAAIDTAYHAALAGITDGSAKTDGIAVGDKAAAAILAERTDDGAATQETYRPHTTAGVYVPTVIPAVPQWPRRKPWLMTSAAQFRPGPPPALTSEVWARDYAEIKALGGKNSTERTAKQTEIASFWEATQPPIYHGVVRSVANMPGREVTQNARLFVAVTQAVDDAMIAVFDAKYHHGFWRPITAIRNGHDGNDATTREAGWTPFIDTPMHPEYPCAHCIVSSSMGAVLAAEIGAGPAPRLSSASPTAQGAVRTWASVDEFTREVALARIYDGVHYRNSTVVGSAMGKKIGELAVQSFSKPAR